MILVSDLNDRILSTLTAKGNYYQFNANIKPAINSALEWCISIISPLIGTDKFPEEFFREIQVSRVWQTSGLSRVNFNPTDTGDSIWTITGVWCRPNVYVSDASASQSSFGVDYYDEVSPSFGQQTQNAPIVTQAWNGSGNSVMTTFESTFRPELSHRGGLYQAKRMSLEQWSDKDINKFSAGYPCPIPELIQFGYLNYQNYSAKIGDYQLTYPSEIEVAPDIPNELVTVFYIQVPVPVSQLSDTIALPSAMMNIMVQKSLQYISQNQMIGADSYTVTRQELLSLIGAI